MRSRRLATALVCGCFLALPVFAANKNSSNTPKDVDGDNLPPGEFTGSLISTPGTDGLFTVKVEFDRVVLRPGAGQSENREVQQLVREQHRIDRTESELARARNPSEVRRLAQQLNGEMQRMQAHALKAQLQEGADYTIKKDYKNIDFHTADNVKVRTMDSAGAVRRQGQSQAVHEGRAEGAEGQGFRPARL